KAANDAGGKDDVTVVYVEQPAGAALGSPDAPGTRGRRRSRALLGVLAPIAATAFLAVAFWLGMAARDRGGTVPGATEVIAPGTRAVTVSAGGSIMAAVSAAAPGTTVVVEPGEYRERVRLRDAIRLLSRVPRGATIRLPADADESDVAVVASGVTGAEIVGFRVVGDAHTPLGVG